MPQTFPTSVTLEGDRVRLVPLAREHIPALLAIGQATPEAFVHTSTPVTQEEADSYFGQVLKEAEQGSSMPFTIVLKATGEVIGTSRFNNIDLKHRTTNLGYTWYRPDQHGSGSNAEAKYLMLRFIIQEMGIHRVELRTDVNNTQSQRAIEALGATREGVLRRHMVARGGRVRDTVVYSVTDTDWPELGPKLLERVRRKLAAG